MATQDFREDESIRKLLSLLAQNGYTREHGEVERLISQIERMDKQFDAVLSELHEVKQQVHQLQNRGVKASVKRMAGDISAVAAEGKALLTKMKNDLSCRASLLVTAVKEKGVNVLDKTLEALHVRECMGALRHVIHRCGEQAREGAIRVAAIGNELHAIGRHAGNVSRIAAGKQPVEYEQMKSDRGIIAKLQGLLERISGSFERMECDMDTALEGLDTRRKKESIAAEHKAFIRSNLPAVQGERRIALYEQPHRHRVYASQTR